MFDRIRRGWGLTKKAWTVIRSHPSLTKLPLTSGVLALVAFLVFAIPGALLLDAETTAATVGGVALLAIGTYLASFAVIYFNVVLAAGADQALRGEEPDIRRAKGVARSRVCTIAAWAFVSAAVSVVLNVLRDKGGGAGRVGASIGGAIWSLVTFLVLPVLAFEVVGPVAAMKRSAELFRRRWGPEVTGNLVIGGISGLIVVFGVLSGIGGVCLLVGENFGAQVGGGLLVLVGMVVATGGAVFGGATRGVFGVALYRYVDQDRVLGPFTTADLDAAARTRDRTRPQPC